MAETKKFFLDLEGLNSLWSKIKTTFASKSEVQSFKDETAATVAQINQALGTANTNVENVLNMVLAVSPKEVNTYSEALLSASTIVPGIAVKVKNAEEVDGVSRPAGIYLVENTNPASLVYVGSSESNLNTEEIANLINKVAELEKNVVTKVLVTNESGATLSSEFIADNTLIIKRDDQVVANSDSVNALTHRAIAAKFGEFEARLSSIPKFEIAVVEELPTDGISFSKIYLLKNTNSSTNNLYTEYLYIQDSTNGNHWEKLGEQTIVLSDYVTKSEVEQVINAAMKDYATKVDVAQAKAEVLSEVSKTYATIETVASKVSASEVEGIILTSIQEGMIGKEIAITNEQIESLS